MKILGLILYLALIGCATYLFKYNHTFTSGWYWVALVGNVFCWSIAINLVGWLLPNFWRSDDDQTRNLP